MRLTSVRIAGAVLLALLVLGTTPPRELADAEGLLEKHLYQEALGVYERVLGETDDDATRQTACLRICECLVGLDRYGEALERLLDWELPEAPAERARLLLVRARLVRDFRAAYAGILRQDVIDEGESDESEVYRLTPGELDAMALEAYRELWGLRSQLVKMNAAEEDLLFFKESVDPGLYPTLFDFLISDWTDFLLGDRSQRQPRDSTEIVDAGLLLVDDFDRPVNLSDPPALLAAELLEEASRFHPEGRLQAGELRRIMRLRLPITHSAFFDFSGLAGDEAAQSKDGAGIYAERSTAILLGWMKTFTTDEGRAEAGYQAALLLQQQDRLVEAVQVCDSIVEEFSTKTRGGACADALRAQITRPTLDLTARTVMPPGTGSLTVTSKNVSDLYFRIYEIDPHRLRDEYEAYLMKYERMRDPETSGWSAILDSRWFGSRSGEAWLLDLLSEGKPYREWSTPTTYSGDYKAVRDVVDPPPLVAGVYLAVASRDNAFGLGTSLLSACYLNVTRLVLVGSAGVTGVTRDAYYDFVASKGSATVLDKVFRLYGFDAENGQAARDMDVSAVLYEMQGPKSPPLLESFKADRRGVLSLDMPVEFKVGRYSHAGVDPLAEFDNSYAFWSHMLYAYYVTPNPVSIEVELDRPIYQPGDEVRAKAVVVKRTSRGFETCRIGATIEFAAQDANNKEIFRETAELGPFGSASTAFVIPHGHLLGRYSLNVRYADLGFEAGGRAGFSVEEYKRPEFEMMLEPAAEPWKYHEPTEIKGKASYYFGGPVPDAPVTYSIKRRSYISFWFDPWYRTGLDRGTEELAQGEVTTGPDGTFSIPFVPEPPLEPLPGWVPAISQYTVKIEGRDAGGRTIEAERSYRAGAQALYLVLDPAKGFFAEDDTVVISAGRFTLNDTPEGGRGTYEVFALGAVPEDTSGGDLPAWRMWSPCVVPPLEVQLQAAPNSRLLEDGGVDHAEDGAGRICFGPLPAGAYRVIEKTADAWGDTVSQGRIIVVTGGRECAVQLDAYSVAVFEKQAYEVGDVAKCLIGCRRGSGSYHVEIWAGDYLVDHQVVEGGHAVRAVAIPVTSDLKGGFTLRWFGVRNLEVRCGQAGAAVPWREKKLAVTLDPFDKEMKPGHGYEWGVKVADWEGKPARAEVLALMYDRSLEYYVEGYSRWLDGLYAQKTARLDLRQSVLRHRGQAFHPQYAKRTCPKMPDLPRLRMHKTWFPIGRWGEEEVLYGKTGRVVSLEEAIAAAPGVVLEAFQVHIRGGRAGEMEVPQEASAIAPEFEFEEQAAEIEARSEFTDAVFFEPHLVTGRDGTAGFAFTIPEQLTAWKIKVFAHTPDVKEGSLVDEAVTRKDLIVRADLPRFFREGDEGTVTAMVHNESDSTLTGEVFIDISQDGENVNARLGLEVNREHFSVGPHGLKSFDWRVEIPAGVGTYTVRVAGVAKGLSDAEERELPVLPSRQRLTESAFAVLSGSGSSTLELQAADDPTRQSELAVLQVEPQLALSILNTIPFLVEYPYGCVEQILNRYVPLSIVNEIYDDYPGIREAVADIPKRKTTVPPWESDDPRRLMTLMETPWVWEAEGRAARWPIIDLLDPEIVGTQKEANLEKLREAQLSCGGFPWWPGGRDDPYMTLYVLAGFAEAGKYGVEVPTDMIRGAFTYLNQTLLHDHNKWEKHIPLIAYAGYVLTAYSPEEIPEAAASRDLILEWLEILEKVIGDLRPLPKAYVAYTYFRLGNEARAQEILDMALDGAREDPIVGVYWTPEKYSWVWYSDTVEKHAFFLRALQDMRPEDGRIPGLVKWLLFNRKGNVWKSTKASAAAVYALLDYMRLKGALVGNEVFEAEWGGKTYATVVEADQWLDEPLRWEERGFDIGDDDLRAVIKKEGPGTAFASLTWIYSTDQLPQASEPGLLELERRFYRRIREGDAYHLKPIASGDEVAVGDEIEVQLKINSRSQFEYMHLKDVKASGFEAERLLSGWRYDPIGFYEEPRHSLTNFFLSWLPHGEYILRYRLKPTKPGTYRIGAATLQSMYAPEMAAHSAGFVIKVTD
jgi:uncharacterized protein YfaS (alpha-2-macroglobulin family)